MSTLQFDNMGGFMNYAGITLIIIILVPVLFQVVYSGLESRKQHREILERLRQLETKLDQ